MVFNRFILNVLIRVVFISGTAILFSVFIGQPERLFTIMLLVILTIAQVYLLFRYVSKTNSELANFLIYVKEGDIISSYPEKLDSAFGNLKDTFQSINKEFERIRKEKAQREEYTRTILQQIQTGIISFDQNGKIDLINDAAKNILETNEIYHLSDLDKINNGLTYSFKSLPSGRKKITKIVLNDQIKVLSLQSTQIKINEKIYSVTSFQNIKSELDANELTSYKKLIRILAHEIMNSLTPITTLTKTIKKNLPEEIINDNLFLSKENYNDIIESTALIDDRSKGLIKFVENYRSITQLPKPSLSDFALKKFFTEIKALFIDECSENNINVDITIIPESASINADRNMLNQVFINLFKNSFCALKGVEKPVIRIETLQNTHDQTQIKFQDNGIGIKEENLDKIFMPFYTTREGGTGIGLSLSKQILHLHGASFNVFSKENEGATFFMNF